jgi:hypothetical protein
MTLEPAVTAPPFGMNVGDPHGDSMETPLLLVELAALELLPPKPLDPDPEPLLELEGLFGPELLPLPLDPEPLALPLLDPEPELLPPEPVGPELDPEAPLLASPPPTATTAPGGAASKLSPGVYVGRLDGLLTTLDPHPPVLGWQLWPDGHVDIGSPSAPTTVTCPRHTSASTSHSAATRSVGACTCATRCTTGCPSLKAVSTISTSWSALCPAITANVAGSVAASDGTG